MERVEDVIKLVEEFEEGLRSIEEKVARARAELVREVDVYLQEARALFSKIVEESRRNMLEEAAKAAEEEGARIREEYRAKTEQVMTRLSSKREELVRFVLQSLLPTG
ncbi:hypothetical protein HRbin02_00454 [Candidatus Calditenuaceae archaeon HR02]|nr:hypothetical protein HRbin02_00454 [Candidatus Calditenuaceae archaeon HR02]